MLTVIADAVVQASVGKGLRVAVACPNSHLALVDHLAQALHARGRACRCLPMTPNPRDAVPPDRQATGSTIVVIASGPNTEVDRGTRRVNISVIADVQRDGELSHSESDEAYSWATGDSDIIIDYRNPDGPVIRYMAPYLAAQDQP
ncbi:hypothetical protein GA0070624_3436 [Micromonospora rhizosphaerae]|uniref:Uncharacterized protein n=1 Tax=Micromonospora rhizosphaerae TaxID=568872 RepID=A0A1C6SCD4_9ACTN|nr:hypothetical protein GA0070624_3436 [Micromonospora rhizosphaerae]